MNNGTRNVTYRCDENGTWPITETPRCQADCPSYRLLNSTSGVIYSPNYPENYPVSQNCRWSILVPTGRSVRISFPVLQTEYDYDVLELYAGYNRRNLLVTASGDIPPEPVKTNSSIVDVYWKSDMSNTDRGFTLMYNMTPCGIPKPPINGSIEIIEGLDVGDSITYQCRKGHDLVGKATAVCTLQGWNSPTPTCPPKSCGNLTAPANGYVSGGSLYSNRVSYSCQRGYMLKGDIYRMCTAEGVWSGASPTCEVTTCKQLQAPEFGKISGAENYVFGAKVKLSCRYGLKSGSLQRECSDGGYWTGYTTICKDPLECNFENGFCQYSLSGTQTWLRNRGQTSSSGTGPSVSNGK
ncbi:CUB and sushi domain-containing protein 1-like [Lingula anatina]|uniref:CUB and sushi domain-containing protein 1-like n=1 Tax=Lingula anatina TaxID=7574 RepID=A0A1S3K5E2_LINAN|nr:CUB and sushi domain-containing protein 1-like [Lingula anatina]|eukprot:XP_013417639.2 CUB and sushi domain-containing protein 1-like [Lingula anatina]